MFRVTYQEEFQVMVDLTGLSHPGPSLVKGAVIPSPRAMVLTDSWTLSLPPKKMAPRSPHQARPQDRPQLDIPKAGRWHRQGPFLAPYHLLPLERKRALWKTRKFSSGEDKGCDSA